MFKPFCRCKNQLSLCSCTLIYNSHPKYVQTLYQTFLFVSFILQYPRKHSGLWFSNWWTFLMSGISCWVWNYCNALSTIIMVSDTSLKLSWGTVLKMAWPQRLVDWRACLYSRVPIIKRWTEKHWTIVHVFDVTFNILMETNSLLLFISLQ